MLKSKPSCDGDIWFNVCTMYSILSRDRIRRDDPSEHPQSHPDARINPHNAIVVWTRHQAKRRDHFRTQIQNKRPYRHPKVVDHMEKARCKEWPRCGMRPRIPRPRNLWPLRTSTGITSTGARLPRRFERFGWVSREYEVFAVGACGDNYGPPVSVT